MRCAVEEWRTSSAPILRWKTGSPVWKAWFTDGISHGFNGFNGFQSVKSVESVANFSSTHIVAGPRVCLLPALVSAEMKFCTRSDRLVVQLFPVPFLACKEVPPDSPDPSDNPERP